MILSSGFGKIPVEEIRINPWELANRLGTSREYTSVEVKECIERLKEKVDCSYAYVRVSVQYLGENRLDLGFGAFESKVLSKNLAGCREAFVFAVTIGLGVDRLLTKLSHLTPSGYFMTDAAASALVEAAADEAERRIHKGKKCQVRFSPGFGDFTLEYQPAILQLSDAERKLGIKINHVLLMSPMKSVTAVMGVKNGQ